MKKRQTIIVFIVIVFIAAVAGFVLVNRGDGPVMGMILSKTAFENVNSYKEAENSQSSDIFCITSSEYGSLVDKRMKTPAVSDTIVANVHFVECRKGTEFTAKWLNDGQVVQQEKKALPTDMKGVVAWTLDAENVRKGTWRFEVYYGDKLLIQNRFDIY